ncbi:MAG: AAA family ATPase [Bacillota bacterium]
MKRTVYIISGPAGIGKSTVARELAKSIDESACIKGDDVIDMHVSGQEPPWKSDKELDLVWNNIIALTRNFLKVGDVVIDYVTFPSRLTWIKETLNEYDVLINYVLLWAEDEVLKKRDLLRPPEQQMKKRSIILKREFEEENPNERYLLNTGKHEAFDVKALVSTILSDDRFLITKDNNEEYWRKMYDRFKK